MMRKAEEEFTPENMLQFQFLIGMREEEREIWAALFKRIDTSNDGLLSQEEVFEAMNLKVAGLKLEFVSRLFSYFRSSYGGAGADDRRGGGALNEHSFFLGVFNFCR